jgi:hypothetical protein
MVFLSLTLVKGCMNETSCLVMDFHFLAHTALKYKEHIMITILSCKIMDQIYETRRLQFQDCTHRP